MYRAVARMLRGDVACLVAGAGILAFVVSTNAEKLLHDSSSAGTVAASEVALDLDRAGLPTDQDRTGPDLRLAIPRPYASMAANGGSASGGIAGPAATSQASGFEVGEGYAVGFIDGQVGWAAGAASLAEPTVDTANPFGGSAQHLRIGHDPAAAPTSDMLAFSPNMGIFTNVSAVVSAELYITGTGRDYEIVPQSPSEGQVVTIVRFNRVTKVISVLDDLGGGGVFINTGFLLAENEYANVTIDLNTVAGTVTIFYKGVQIYQMAALVFGTAVQEVVFTGINANNAAHLADVDDYSVVGGPEPTGACCNFDGMSGCAILSADACFAAAGTYLGNDTLCDACPMGACCNFDAMKGCVVITPEECAGLVDAFYIGDATLCVDCPTVFPTCGSGGDCLIAHALPGCDDIACCALVCDQLPNCCVVTWDANCAAAAIDTFCTPDAACGVPGTGSCTDGGNGTPFCDDTCGAEGPCAGCCDTVCAVDPYCCAIGFPAGNWDVLCDGEALALCGCEAGQEPSNDECITAIELFLGPPVVVANFCGTSGLPDHATCNDGFVLGLGIDVWFTHTATFTGALNVIPTPDDDLTWNTQMAIYEGCDCGALTDPPLVCAPIDDQATVLVTSGTCYTIRLGGTFDGPTGSGFLELAAVPAACLDAVNDCLAPAGTGGCGDLSCCAVVCLANLNCCTVAWDQACADAAQLVCAPLPCPAIDVVGANVDEGESCGFDTNGGCNSDPAVFTEIVSGNVIHGVAWADLGGRDTDWYRLTIDPLADVNMDGMVDVYYSVVSELPIVGFLIRDLDPTCGPGGTDPNLVSTTAYGQSCTCINPGVGTVGINDAIYVFAATGEEGGGSIFEGFPCTGAEGPTFGNNYLYSVDVVDNGDPSPQVCGAAKPTCPWDCQIAPPPDGNVGIEDFLAVLAQWTTIGSSCDIAGDPNGVGINAFLAILANWGACP